MNLVDGKGTDLGINIGGTFKSITKVLGYELPNDIDIPTEYNITSEYGELLINTIKEWMAEYAGDRNKIPFILHTDQHGKLSKVNYKGIFKLISSIVNWDEISVCMNLGDVVTDHWEPDDTNEDVWLRNEELEKAMDTLSVIPKNKQINVFGNHDTWKKYTPEDTTWDIVDLKYVQPYFKNYNQIEIEDNSGNFVFYDYNFNIKYLCLGSWDRQDTYVWNRYGQHRINTDHWKWIVKQLEKNDGYDIVILSHFPLYLDHAQAFDPITGEASTRTGEMYLDTLSEGRFSNLFNARKNKTTGSFEDGEGYIHTYDFTQCKGNLLCALSGHTHYDEYDYMEDGLLSLSFDELAYQVIFLSLIDREKNTIKVWKFSSVDSATVDIYELSLDKEDLSI